MEKRWLAVAAILAVGACSAPPPPPAGGPSVPPQTPLQRAVNQFFGQCIEPDPLKTHAEATRLGYRRPEDLVRREVLGGRAGDVFLLPPERELALMLGETPRQCEIWVPNLAPRDIDPEFTAGLDRLRSAGATVSLVNQAESAAGLTKTYLIVTADRVARLFAFGPNRRENPSFRSVLSTTNDPGRIADARLQAR